MRPSPSLLVWQIACRGRPRGTRLGQWHAALTPEHLAIAAAFATWPRGWQQGAAGWLARRAEGGFTREVVSHVLFLMRRQLGPLVRLRQLAGVAAMTRGEPHALATLREALEVQEMAEAILADG